MNRTTGNLSGKSSSVIRRVVGKVRQSLFQRPNPKEDKEQQQSMNDGRDERLRNQASNVWDPKRSERDTPLVSIGLCASLHVFRSPSPEALAASASNTV